MTMTVMMFGERLVGDGPDWTGLLKTKDMDYFAR